MNQNPFAAQYDYLGFGRIEIVTKPGADNFRGGVGLTDSDAFFNSRNPYADNKADYVNRMFTANLGGPLSHRASFLVNFYHSTINNTALINAVTLSPGTLAEVPLQSSVLTPRADISGNARLDYQITPNQTFTGVINTISAIATTTGSEPVPTTWFRANTTMSRRDKISG